MIIFIIININRTTPWLKQHIEIFDAYNTNLKTKETLPRINDTGVDLY